VTEAEWLNCTEPDRMLAFLEGKGSIRKLRLFACGLWRWAQGHQLEEPVRRVVEVVEQIADGLASLKRLRKAMAGTYGGWATHWAVALCKDRVRDWATEMWWARSVLEDAYRVVLLHDIFGNPFRQVAAASSWLAWNDRTVTKLAQASYDERRFKSLPILADALEDAGCDNADILAHCRDPGPHVRGCWVVDLLLAKEPQP
jgi:hypothetical protein